MEIINRNEITDETYREILDVETHHEHIIYKDEYGTLRWKEDNAVREMVDKIGLNDICQLFDSLGLNRNSELIRKMYRDMGYSLFGYWEIFYCEANNDIANEYVPQKEIKMMGKPTIIEKNNLPVDVRYSFNEGVDLYQCIQHYEIGNLTRKEFINDMRNIKARYQINNIND